jgi:hypothetical protein
MKWAIAIGAVSFGVTLGLLRADHGVAVREPAVQPAAERSAPEPPRAGDDVPANLPADFESARLAAERIGTTPEGLKYQDDASPKLSTVLQERLASCMGDSSPLGQTPFAIVVGIAADGVVGSTWAAPETPLASCVLHRLAGVSLPPPPMPHAWMAANIRPDATAPEAEPER